MIKRIIRIVLFCSLICVFLLLLFQLLPKNKTNPQNKPNNYQLQAKSVVQQCEKKDTWRTCYGEELAKVVANKGFSFFLKTLESVKIEDTRTKDCHLIAHFASHEAVEKDTSKWIQVLSEVELSDCFYGYIHGTLESLSANDKSFEISVENAPALCKKIAEVKASLDPERGCSHVVGHLLLSQKCDRPIENTLAETVNQCRNLPEKMHHECFAGAFMESITRNNLESECGTELIQWNSQTSQNQERICRSYTEDAASSCWQEISHMYTQIYHNDFELVYKACNKAPQRDQALLCYYHSLVTLIPNQNKDSEYFRSACQPLVGNETEYSKCISSAVGSIIAPSVKLIDSGIRFCKAYPAKYESLCYGTIIYYIRGVSEGSERKKYCQILPALYQYACINLPNKDSVSF